MRKSKLSPELRSELKKYADKLRRLNEQEAKVRELMEREGVFDDGGMLSEAADRLPSCYLRFSFFERLYELEPRVRPDRTPME